MMEYYKSIDFWMDAYHGPEKSVNVPGSVISAIMLLSQPVTAIRSMIRFSLLGLSQIRFLLPCRLFIILHGNRVSLFDVGDFRFG
jgi:hypothetical protein